MVGDLVFRLWRHLSSMAFRMTNRASANIVPRWSGLMRAFAETTSFNVTINPPAWLLRG
jgi:hypothetical protein